MNPKADPQPEPEGVSHDTMQDKTAPSQETAAQQPVEKDEGILAGVQEELNKTRDQLLRALADAENTRRRAVKEREDAGKYAVSSFAKDLLDFSDNVRRAIEAVPDDLKNGSDDRIKNLIAGLAAMEQQMLRTFEKHGIKKLNPMNEVFDPNFHEVIFEAPDTGKPGGVIIQVAEPGYTLHGRLLRPARVGVAKGDGSGRVDTQA